MWILLVLGASAASRTSSQVRAKGIDSPAEGWDLATFLNNYVQLQGFNSVHFLRDSNGESDVLCSFYSFIYLFILCIYIHIYISFFLSYLLFSILCILRTDKFHPVYRTRVFAHFNSKI